LSREEVLAILGLLNVADIPGLGEDPIPNLSDEQQAMGLIVAERALRARGLATINEEGRLLIQSDILEMLGSCAYASQSLFVTQMAAPSGGVMQIIAHQRADSWVLHTRPDQVLHTFERLDSWPQTVTQLIDYCQWPREMSGPDYSLAVDSQTLSTVRDLAESDKIEQAKQLLKAAGNEPEAVEALVSLLSAPHFVTVVQRVKIESADSMSIQSVTVLHRDQVLLVAVESAETAENGDQVIVTQPASLDGLEQVLTEMVAVENISEEN
jgi:hypothetical protein